MNKKWFLLIFLILIISGCATTANGPLFKEAPVSGDKKSTLYIFQVKKPLVYPATAKINGKPFVQLARNGYSYTYLSPGVYKLSFDTNVLALAAGLVSEIEIQEGKDIYLEFSDGSAQQSLREIPKEQALEKFKNFSYIEPLNTEFQKT